MFEKGFAPIFIVLGVLILSLGIVGSSFFIKNNVLTKKVINSTSNTPLQTTTSPNPTINSDPTSYWKLFIDEYMSYSLKYPSEVYIRLSCPEYKNELILVKRNTTDEGDILELQECDRKTDLRLQTSNYYHYGGGSISKPISTEDIVIDGTKATKNTLPESIQVSLELNKINYDFYFYGLENKKLFDQILNTFKFLDQTKLKNDAKRLDDFAIMQTAINFSTQVASLNTPIVDILCKGANTHRYPCFGSSTGNIKASDGDGWIKIDLNSQKAASVKELPFDPVNDNANHYVYCADGDSWEINTVLESPQQLEKMQNDGGDDENRYEVGSSLQLVDKIPSCNY